MAKHLLLVGGGHAHMVILANLRVFINKGHKVTVVGPSPYHYYSGMGPGMLGRTYAPDDIRFFTQHVVEKQGGIFILGKAARVDPEGRKLILESGDTVPYDVISFNVGSYVPETCIMDTARDVFTVKPIEKLIDAQARILELASRKKIAIGIVGGGPSAAEIAGNVWRLAQDYGPKKPVIRIFAGKDFMSKFPVDVKKRFPDRSKDAASKFSNPDMSRQSKPMRLSSNQVKVTTPTLFFWRSVSSRHRYSKNRICP